MNDSLNALCCEEISTACCPLNPFVAVAVLRRGYVFQPSLHFLNVYF